jgi:hypothetical protein
LSNLRIPFLAIVLAGILVVTIKVLLAPEIEPPKKEEETPGALYLPPLKNNFLPGFSTESARILF